MSILNVEVGRFVLNVGSGKHQRLNVWLPSVISGESNVNPSTATVLYNLYIKKTHQSRKNSRPRSTRTCAPPVYASRSSQSGSSSLSHHRSPPGCQYSCVPLLGHCYTCARAPCTGYDLPSDGTGCLQGLNTCTMK